MPNYIMLAHYTERGRRMGRTNPNLLTEAAARVETPSGRILTQYAVLGRYDFVIIAEAADNQSALRLSLDLGGLAGINIETLAALPIGVITHRDTGADALDTGAEVNIVAGAGPDDGPVLNRNPDDWRIPTPG